MKKGLLWSFISTAFLVTLSISIIDLLKGNLTGTDGTLWTRSLVSLLDYLSNLDVIDVSWAMRYCELGTWPSWIDWALTLIEWIGTLLSYFVSLVFMAVQALIYVLGFIAWVFV